MSLQGILRQLLGIERKLTPDDAVAIAKQECARRGIEFMEPAYCTERMTDYVIASPGDRIGGVAFIRVSVTTGRVVSFWLSTR